MKSIKFSDYFEIVKPKYMFLKLKPHHSIRNYNSDKIAKAVASTYQSILRCFRFEDKKLWFEHQTKVGYMIYMERCKIEFYFIVPERHLTLIKDKIRDTWSSITIDIVQELPMFSTESLAYTMTYKKEDALSLATDKRTNTLLSSILNSVGILEEQDKVAVFYNLTACEQVGWRSRFQDTIQRYMHNQPIDREKANLGYVLKIIFMSLLETVEMTIKSLADIVPTEKNDTDNLFKLFFKQTKELTPETLKKKDAQIINTEIIVMSEGINKRSASIAVSEAFKSITGDNELIRKRTKPISDYTQISYTDKINVSTDEAQNFLALPARELLEEYGQIEKIDTKETKVPEELQQGNVRLGTNIYSGNETPAFMSTHPEYSYCAHIFIGPAGSGKSTLFTNISYDTIKAGDCTIVFDFCGSCELSETVKSHIEKYIGKKSLIIDCSDVSKMQGLGYNEIKPCQDTFLQYVNAKDQTSQLLTLIDSVNTTEKSAKMDRYLKSSALVTFINNGSIKDVFKVLTDWKFRSDRIRAISKDQLENLEESIMTLQEIDEKDKEGDVVGTKSNISLQGILDRLDKLKMNAYMERMLKLDCSNNIDLVKELQQNQLICIKIPEHIASTEAEKDTMCVYWLSKLWLSAQIRRWQYTDGKIPELKKVNLIIDELAQVPKTQELLAMKLNQLRKFRVKPIISCHNLSQIDKIKAELFGANASYTLLTNCNKFNYRELQEELAPYEFEDLQNLKDHHALHLIKCKDGMERFITKLPDQLKNHPDFKKKEADNKASFFMLYYNC